MTSIHHYSFIWDENKALSNEHKHGITFQEAVSVFDDPLAATFIDPDRNTAEERWLIVGLTKGHSLVVVVHVFSDGNGGAVVRIVSARKATSHERCLYETDRYSIREPKIMGELKTEEEFEMREEYDIPPDAERGKFYSPNATRSFPIYLDHDVLKYFTDIAESRGIETRVLLSELLRRQMPTTGACGPAETGSQGVPEHR